MLLALWTLTLLACNGERGWRGTSVPSKVADQIQGNRPVTALATVAQDTLKALTAFHLPDSLAALYRMSFPVTVAVADAPHCWVAVGDVVDRAVHIFRVRGDYAFSLFGGGREHAAFEGAPMTSLAPSGANQFLVLTLGGRVVTFDSAGSLLKAYQLEAPPVANQRDLGGQVTVGPDGLVYDHWFAGDQIVVRPNEWAQDGSLIRVYDPQGHLVRRIGRVIEYPGKGLTHYLNRGEIRIFSDTLWLARRADARILAFPLKGPYDRPARIVELPVFFRAEVPVEYVRVDDRKVAVRVQEHLRAFAIAPDGDFYVVQHVSWPAIAKRGGAFVPKSVIAVVSRAGELKQVLSGGGNVVALAAADNGPIGVLGQSGRLTPIAFATSAAASNRGSRLCTPPARGRETVSAKLRDRSYTQPQ